MEHCVDIVENSTACISMFLVADPPRNVKVAAPSDEYGVLVVTWTPPPFTADQGYIKSFIIFYCEFNTSNLSLSV